MERATMRRVHLSECTIIFPSMNADPRHDGTKAPLPRLGYYRKGRRLHADDAIRRWIAGATGRSKDRPRRRPNFFRDRYAQRKAGRDRTAPDVGLVFIDPKDKAYLSITGRACIMRDVAKTRRPGEKPTKCGGLAAPPIPTYACYDRALTAELWDGPASTAVAAFEFAKARLTGEEPKLGENRKVTVEM